MRSSSIFIQFICIAGLSLLHQAVSDCPRSSSRWEDLGGDFCYLIEKHNKVTWIDAVYQCFTEGGSLTSFHSAEEIQKLLNYLGEQELILPGEEIGFYIGLRKDSNGGFAWVDKSELDFVNWFPGEPNYGTERCVEMYESGLWNDINCNARFGYICSSPKNLPLPSQENFCPRTSSDWEDLGGEACYIIGNEAGITWDAALSRCTEKGGSLATFHSFEEISAVVQRIKPYHRDYYIGLRKTNGERYEWTDQSPVDLDFRSADTYAYHLLDEEEISADQKCTEMHARNGEWSDAFCGKLSGYICSVPKEFHCGGNIVADRGIIQSPNHPANYRPEEYCMWNIKVPENNRIFLKFHRFDLDYSFRCTDDYVEIRYVDRTGPNLERFCGSFAPDDILTVGNEMTIIFGTDYSNENSGFFAEFRKDICGGDIFSDTGVITSPNFPEDYRKNENCIWKITVPEGYRVILHFTTIQMESGYDCNSDFVEVRDGHESDSNVLGRFCGFDTPGIINSSTNKVTVTFETDDFIERKGFKLRFRRGFL